MESVRGMQQPIVAIQNARLGYDADRYLAWGLLIGRDTVAVIDPPDWTHDANVELEALLAVPPASGTELFKRVRIRSIEILSPGSSRDGAVAYARLTHPVGYNPPQRTLDLAVFESKLSLDPNVARALVDAGGLPAKARSLPVDRLPRPVARLVPDSRPARTRISVFTISEEVILLTCRYFRCKSSP